MARNINYLLYRYDLNIANYKEWSDERLTYELEKANNLMEITQRDIYEDRKALMKELPPHYVGDSYRWAKHVAYTFEQELKQRGVIEKDENDFFWDELLD